MQQTNLMIEEERIDLGSRKKVLSFSCFKARKKYLKNVATKLEGGGDGLSGRATRIFFVASLK